MNNKGFVMTETLVVTVFLVTIFTFIYTSIVPLIGRYEDLIDREGDIDIVYKLYNIRKLIESDANRTAIISPGKNVITCDSFSTANRTYCNKLMEFMELTNYKLLYLSDVLENIQNDYIKGISEEIYDYIYKYKNVQSEVLILLDSNTHAITHLFFDGYYGDKIKPTYYNFGSIPNTSSSTTAPDEYNVYLGLFSNNAYGVCVRMSESQYCLKSNDYLTERDHILRVFSRYNDKCVSQTNKIDCSNDNFACTLENSGKVSCRDKISNKTCILNSNNTASCS